MGDCSFLKLSNCSAAAAAANAAVLNEWMNIIFVNETRLRCGWALISSLKATHSQLSHVYLYSIYDDTTLVMIKKVT